MTEETFQELNLYMRNRYGVGANEIDRPKTKEKEEKDERHSKSA